MATLSQPRAGGRLARSRPAYSTTTGAWAASTRGTINQGAEELLGWLTPSPGKPMGLPTAVRPEVAGLAGDRAAVILSAAETSDWPETVAP